MLLKINPINPQERLIKHVVEHLKKGGIIAYPTDTFYGIGCDIMNKKAIERVYQIKQRQKNKPFQFYLFQSETYQPLCQGFQLCLPNHEKTSSGALYLYFGRFETGSQDDAHQTKNSRYSCPGPSNMFQSHRSTWETRFCQPVRRCPMVRF